MPVIELKYGGGSVPFEYPAERFDVLGQALHRPALSDVDIGERLDHPIDSPPLEDLIQPGRTVLIVVPDATRKTASGQIVNLVVRRLIASGIAPFDIRIIFATGIHRKVTDRERESILTPFINQRIKTIDHDARDLAQLVRVGETSTGIPVELNRALTEHDHVILVGGVSFHYFAGFAGGRKLVCPGLASSRTISQSHKLAFDCETMSRRTGVDTGLLDGNAVHEAFVEAVSKIAPPFAISTIVNDQGEAVDVYCGDWQTSHRAACKQYASDNSVAIDAPRDIVIASCGGYPHDINMIQAQKALDSASRACKEGGTIVLLAECSDGTGRADFIDWFDTESSETLAAKLCEKYQVNGQTAWSLLRKAERHQVEIVTTMDEQTTNKMRLRNIEVSRLTEFSRGTGLKGYILPNGARTAIKING